jgi:hypothetical protein
LLEDQVMGLAALRFPHSAAPYLVFATASCSVPRSRGPPLESTRGGEREGAVASGEGLGPCVRKPLLCQSRDLSKKTQPVNCFVWLEEKAKIEPLNDEQPMGSKMPTVPGAGTRYIRTGTLACHPHGDARNGTKQPLIFRASRLRSVSRLNSGPKPFNLCCLFARILFQHELLLCQVWTRGKRTHPHARASTHLVPSS